jgi:hypothetical protein
LTASDVQNYLQDQSVMVFGGTAARSSAIGTANFEEGMLTYLTDVDKLQVYTGATFADVYPPATSNQGLTLINTTAFSAVSSISLPANTFTSTYTNYRIIYVAEVNSVGQLTMRLRAAGSDNSTSNYSFQNYAAQAAGVTAGRATGQTSWEVVYQQSYDVPLVLDLFRPQATAKTLFLSQNMKDPYNLGAAMAIGQVGGGFNATTSFDSATFIPSAGTITGTVFAYAYNI